MNLRKHLPLMALTLAAAVALPSAAHADTVSMTGLLNPNFGNVCTTATGTSSSYTKPTTNTIQIPIHIAVNQCG